jgi:hypothetical protein
VPLSDTPIRPTELLLSSDIQLSFGLVRQNVHAYNEIACVGKSGARTLNAARAIELKVHDGRDLVKDGLASPKIKIGGEAKNDV